jgi:hypothetical protein
MCGGARRAEEPCDPSLPLSLSLFCRLGHLVNLNPFFFSTRPSPHHRIHLFSIFLCAVSMSRAMGACDWRLASPEFSIVVKLVQGCFGNNALFGCLVVSVHQGCRGSASRIARQGQRPARESKPDRGAGRIHFPPVQTNNAMHWPLPPTRRTLRGGDMRCMRLTSLQHGDCGSQCQTSSNGGFF